MEGGRTLNWSLYCILGYQPTKREGGLILYTLLPAYKEGGRAHTVYSATSLQRGREGSYCILGYQPKLGRKGSVQNTLIMIIT